MTVTRSATVGHLPQFLRYLSGFPPPEKVLEALAAGPLARQRMVGGFLWILVDGSHLVSVGCIGWPIDLEERYSVIPIGLDLPAARAPRENEITVDGGDGFGSQYVGSIDEEYLDGHFTAKGVKSVVNLPLRHARSVVGCFGFVTDETWEVTDESTALLESLSSTLGLWATHPKSGVLGGSVNLTQRDWSLAFTERQKQVLALVGQGRSNSQIALQLHVSVSSVKQDVQHMMRALRTHSRDSAFERAQRLKLLD